MSVFKNRFGARYTASGQCSETQGAIATDPKRGACSKRREIRVRKEAGYASMRHIFIEIRQREKDFRK